MPHTPIVPTSTEGMTVGVMRWLLASRTPLAPREFGSGMHLLRYPWQIKVASLGGALVAGGFLAVGYLGFQAADAGGAVYWVVPGASAGPPSRRSPTAPSPA